MMKWLNRFFKTVPPDEREGISLEYPKWEVSCCKDMPIFLRSLIGIIPEGSILYLEDGSPDKIIESYFEKRKASNQKKVALGTIWPQPICFHVPFTSENINELAKIMEQHATPEVCIHLHIYIDEEVLLQWHDAFDDPMYIADTINEEQITQFCNKISSKYKSLSV